jgi:hypothetical protein
MDLPPPPRIGMTMSLPAILRWRCLTIGIAFAVPWATPRPVPGQSSPRTFVLIVSGASGEPRFAEQFHKEAMALRSVAGERFGIPDSLIAYLAEDPSKNPAAITGRSTREGVTQAIENIATRAHRGDRVFILLLGHGSMQNDESRFSMPGPDLTAGDFAELLDRLAAQSVAFIDASSASGDFVKRLSGPNRIIITATKSGFEGNETLFAEHFVDAFVKDGADTDKDGRVSILEAFIYAHREVQRAYEQTNRLQTEHAMLDDDGDGVGHADPSDKGPDGLRARTFFLGSSAVSAALASNPKAAELLATQQRLQSQIDSLRALRSGMKEEDFQRALEPLVIKLAETTQALKALEVKKP